MNHANTEGLYIFFFSFQLFHPYLSQVYEMMLRDERYYPSFKQSPLYVRMLAELDMLKEPSYRGSDDGDGESFNGSPTGSINLVSLLHFLLQGFEKPCFVLLTRHRWQTT